MVRALGLLLLGALAAPVVVGCSAGQSVPSSRKVAEEPDDATDDESKETGDTTTGSPPPRSTPPPSMSAAPASPVDPSMEKPAEKPPAAASREKLTATMKLVAGEKLSSAGGKATAVYQADGNFVVYGPNGAALFATGTDGKAVGEVIMQEDGNLVLYSDGAPLFNSRTNGNPGAFAIIQDDCNLVVYSAGGAPLWSSGMLCN